MSVIVSTITRHSKFCKKYNINLNRRHRKFSLTARTANSVSSVWIFIYQLILKVQYQIYISKAQQIMYNIMCIIRRHSKFCKLNINLSNFKAQQNSVSTYNISSIVNLTKNYWPERRMCHVQIISACFRTNSGIKVWQTNREVASQFLSHTVNHDGMHINIPGLLIVRYTSHFNLLNHMISYSKLDC